jgi:hypothetical protein
MSLRRWSAVPLFGLAVIAASPGRANDIRFDQGNPTIMTLNITQSGLDHAVHGFAGASTVPDPTAGATLKGNFDTVRLQQTSPAGSDIALRVDVGTGAPSDIFITLSGGPHSVALDAAAERLTSLIDLEGGGTKTLGVTVAATGKVVSHDINLSGNALNMTATQLAGASLIVNLASMGTGATATITQSGDGSTANIMGYLDSNSELVYNQTGTAAHHSLDVNLAVNSKLTFNQEAHGGGLEGSSVTLPAGQTMTMTQTSWTAQP